jgi:hypothetical protein
LEHSAERESGRGEQGQNGVWAEFFHVFNALRRNRTQAPINSSAL